MTMTLVQSITVGVGGAASIEFTGIPQTGQDLLVVLSFRASAVGLTYSNIPLQFNGDTTVGRYSFRVLQGSGSSVTSSVNASDDNINQRAAITGGNATANTFSNGHIYIPNYATATAKSVSSDLVTENNSTESWQTFIAGRYTQASAITSLKLTNPFDQYSTASLYTISTTGATGATVA